ncbi:alkaline phosphatase family protein [Flavobacteriales bacterium]|nr:alkaline phosphatase family protein [Flavobacteriales bacterium]
MKYLFVLLFSFTISSGVFSQKPIERIAFGSCGHQIGEQFIWNSVIAMDPELWIWLGDNIYGDTKDMEVLRRKYQQLGDNYNYGLLKEKCPIIATWDDHDYGINDGGKEYPKRAESQKVFLEFFEEPSESPRWKQEGVYTSYEYGIDGQRVKVILLDQRYHREEPDTDGDVLGEEQWKWLENEFRNSAAKVVLVGASFQFISDQHPFETWGHFPTARERMLNLIKETGVKGVIFLSGDRHFAEISKLERDDLPYTIYDYMCSGLTHANNLMFESNPHRMKGKTYYHRNFGLILFDWEHGSVTLQNRKVNQKVSFEHTIPFSELGW